MKAKKFLRSKKILSNDCHKWIVKFSDGRKFDIVELLNEFLSINKTEK